MSIPATRFPHQLAHPPGTAAHPAVRSRSATLRSVPARSPARAAVATPARLPGRPTGPGQGWQEIFRRCCGPEHQDHEVDRLLVRGRRNRSGGEGGQKASGAGASPASRAWGRALPRPRAVEPKRFARPAGRPGSRPAAAQDGAPPHARGYPASCGCCSHPGPERRRPSRGAIVLLIVSSRARERSVFRTWQPTFSDFQMHERTRSRVRRRPSRTRKGVIDSRKEA